MILRKPYAILIKYFKLIHILMFLIMGYFVFRLRNIYMFFKEYVATSHFTYVADMASEYINSLMFWLLLIILIGSVLIYFLMRKKEKPVLFYKILFVYALVLLIMLFVYRNFFNALEYRTYDSVTIVIYRDITAFLYYINYFYVGFTFVRGFGFDIKKFSFERDLKELNIKETDSEEYELSLGVDKESIATKLRKEKREFGYYLKENALVLSIIGIVLLIGIGVYLYIYFGVTNKVYDENIWIDSNNLSFNIKNSYITNKNKYNEIISNRDNFLVINFGVRNYNNVGVTIKDQSIRLYTDKQYFYPITTYYPLFDDLGKGYNKNSLKEKSESNYILVFKLDKDIDINNAHLEILDYYKKDEYKVKKIGLNIDTVNESNFNYNINDEFNLNENNLVISDYEIKESFQYKYRECDTNNVCEEYTKNVLPRLNNNVLSLNISSFDDNIKKLLEDYLEIEYEINGITKTMSSKDVLIIDNYDKVIYLDINKEIKNSNTIRLIINSRGNKTTINLKGV